MTSTVGPEPAGSGPTAASGPGTRPGRRAVLIAAVAALVVVALSLGGWWLASRSSGTGDPATAARTSLPGLVAPTGEPDLPSLAGTHPRPGEVLQAAGPFDDRLRLEGLRFDGRAVSGSVLVTSDVSDLLELQTVAGFYDASGALLGTARTDYHLDESTASPHAGETPDEHRAFSIAVPAGLTGRAVSAAVGVPVLVNE